MRDHFELELLKKIIDRGIEMARDLGMDEIAGNRPAVAAYIVSCHDFCMKLKLQEMLGASDSEFSHDFFGILRHYDIGASFMNDCFLPRFAVVEELEDLS